MSLILWDLWCGEASLKSFFPEIFSIAANKEATVAEYLESPIHEGSTGLGDWIGGEFFGVAILS